MYGSADTNGPGDKLIGAIEDCEWLLLLIAVGSRVSGEHLPKEFLSFSLESYFDVFSKHLLLEAVVERKIESVIAGCVCFAKKRKRKVN